MFTGLPVAEQRGPKPERPLGSADRHEPVERLPEIVVLRVEPRQPERALRSREGSVALLRQHEAVRGVGTPDLIPLPGRVELFDGVFANRIEHREARFVRGPPTLAEQALAHQRPDPFEHI